jgi:hypothetical protein
VLVFGKGAMTLRHEQRDIEQSMATEEPVICARAPPAPQVAHSFGAHMPPEMPYTSV